LYVLLEPLLGDTSFVDDVGDDEAFSVDFSILLTPTTIQNYKFFFKKNKKTTK